ncbi:HCP-like protein [Neolentinus lepideus HHB14362 ss-1]|uniref:HCP-like protein n=1 Tax=Neolentinus lepideus HHB14362 ss-1 TaxID=1314782 RepID=A0A165RA71_9AGAM|nr:HCP-like protein [Neolentinus lepideus HHB14362 ss-1]
MRCRQATKASWLAFGFIVFAVVGAMGAAQKPTMPQTAGLETPTSTSSPNGRSNADTRRQTEYEDDPTAEANKAYKQALSTLATLTALPPSHTQDISFNSLNGNGNSLLSSFMPNLQGQGPLGSAIRILIKLRYQSWIPKFMGSKIGKDGLGLGSRRREEDLRGKAIKVVDLLQHSAELGNMDALYTLALISLLPPSEYFSQDTKLAYESFNKHASATGNASSQSYLAFLHSTGYQNVVPVDQASAQLYYTFAAHGKDRGAQMALGYRYWSGIGSLEDCERAAEWYEAAAEQAMVKFKSGPPGGRTLPLTNTRLSDLVGGVYGPGASVASTGLNAQRPAIRAANARAAGETWEDVLEYYVFNADRGETDFAYRLGKIFYQGSLYASFGGIASGSEGVGTVPRDFARARYYFLRIARQVWPRDPPNPGQSTGSHRDEDGGPIGYAAASAAYLGRMFLRGEGVKADPAIAKMWFERGAEYGDKECHNGLGIILRDGLVDGRKDTKQALVHFTAAADQDLAEAQVNLGKYYYYRGDYKLAQTCFEAALRNGSPFEAYYYLATVQSANLKNPTVPSAMQSGSCAIAVSFYKLVAERGSWEDDLVKQAEVAWNQGTELGRQTAILKWWIAAERGSEIAQNNLAFFLDQDKSMLRFTRFAPLTPSNDTARLALTQWIRSAAQHNVDALVKVGDYYYHGLGVPEEEVSMRYEKAAGYYQSAAQTQLSALAMWNLGWMYENGIGVPQDFHLAKRHYDLAAETNSEAYLPTLLCLIKLYTRSFLYTLRGGKGGLQLLPYDEIEGSPMYPATENRKISESPESDQNSDNGASPEDRGIEEVDEDEPWYIGKAKEQFNRRRQNRDGQGKRQEDDPVQWARERRNAESERESDFGPEDYFDASLRGARRGEEEEDEFAETLLLITLCIAVSVLLYIRGRWVERIRREAQGQQQQGGNGQAPPAQNQGVFPPPGDAARDDWAILR